MGVQVAQRYGSPALARVVKGRKRTADFRSAEVEHDERTMESEVCTANVPCSSESIYKNWQVRHCTGKVGFVRIVTPMPLLVQVVAHSQWSRKVAVFSELWGSD